MFFVKVPACACNGSASGVGQRTNGTKPVLKIEAFHVIRTSGVNGIDPDTVA
jgi:hypothetical protein